MHEKLNRFFLYYNFPDQHEPPLSKNAQEYLKIFGYNLQALTKPYQSCNIVAKIGDYLSSHSDSRGGGVASRF
jgi:hypothetical protein